MANQILIGDIRGKQGLQGETGFTPHIEVELNPLPAGSSPSVTIDPSTDGESTRTWEYPLLTFNLPVGVTELEYTVSFETDKSTITTTNNFAETYELLVDGTQIPMALSVPTDSKIYNLQYALDTENENIILTMKSQNTQCSFVWTADGLSDFVYRENTIGNFTYTVVKTW